MLDWGLTRGIHRFHNSGFIKSVSKMSWFDENQCGTGYKSSAQSLAHSRSSFIHLVFLLKLLLCTIKTHSRSWRGKRWAIQRSTPACFLLCLSTLPSSQLALERLVFRWSWSETPSLLRAFPHVPPSWWSCLPCVQISSSCFTST